MPVVVKTLTNFEIATTCCNFTWPLEILFFNRERNWSVVWLLYLVTDLSFLLLDEEHVFLFLFLILVEFLQAAKEIDSLVMWKVIEIIFNYDCTTIYF